MDGGGSGRPAHRKPRRFERKRLELPVLIVEADQRTSGGILFDITDLSVGGAFLHSTVLFEIDEELELEFAIDGGKLVRARGRVVRISSNEPTGMGIAFTRLDDHDRDAILNFLQKGS